jgi:hypothetical protein
VTITPGRPHVPSDLPRLDPVVEPRWVRTRRREAARAAARRDAVVDRILRQVAADPRPRRPKTYDELMAEQGVQPFDLSRARRESGLTGADWAQLRAALREVRGR